MNIKPMVGRVVVKATQPEETTKSGIVLTSASKEKPQVSEVVAVGADGILNGNEVKMAVKIGDKVVTAKYSGTEIKVDGAEYTVVRLSDILAVVE